MLLTAYICAMTLATGLMAAGCWLPAIICAIFGLGLSVWCWRKNRENRSANRDQRVASLRG